MRFFFTITKKGLFLMLCATIILFLTAMWCSSLKISFIDGSTHAQRMVYINGLKISVNEDLCTYKETVIPNEFGEVYEEYNMLQKQAGFDLSDFKGKSVTVYSYPVSGEEKVLTLIICDGKIIGGDIAETKINGKMKSLG